MDHLEQLYYNKSPEWGLEYLKTDVESGLSQEEARVRLLKFGPNSNPTEESKSFLIILFSQFKSLLIIMLLIAAFISAFFLNEIIDSLLIGVVLSLNAGLGAWQEFKAQKAVESLRNHAIPFCKVKREGSWIQIKSSDLVPGDIVFLEAGMIVPADGRLIETHDLQIQESMLTGESVPIRKKALVELPDETLLAERKNMAHMGTLIQNGRGVLLITATGKNGQMGKIANLLNETKDDKGPLLKKLDQFSASLLWPTIALIVLIGLESHFLFKLNWQQSLLMAVGMAVAAIPEGLPAVVTLTLTAGGLRLFKHNALIRSLPAVEALGSVTSICTDKTGTLTENKISVTQVTLSDSKSLDPESSSYKELKHIALISGWCNDCQIEKEKIIGDPTEIALFEFYKNVLENHFQDDSWSNMNFKSRIKELPFDSDRKMMTTIHSTEFIQDIFPSPENSYLLLSKGAPETILTKSTSFLENGEIKLITDEYREKFQEIFETYFKKGLRTLALAYRTLDGELPESSNPKWESELIFCGVVAMIDPLKKEAIDSVKICHDAGIKVFMITGDHPSVAQTLGRELGLPNTSKPLTSLDIASMGSVQFEKEILDHSIYARVGPEDKINIVKALKARGEIASMTGDGVNDAPALKAADVGVAMGKMGTDVAKEASDLILLDDNFATIVKAIKEGRIIFDNISNFIRFILSSNLAEIFIMFCAPLLNLPIPLFPGQILWLNLVTDGLPALALGMEKDSPGIMKRPPNNPNAPILNKQTWIHILWVGALIGVSCLLVTKWPWLIIQDETTWRTMVFTTLVFSQLGLAVAERSFTHVSWKNSYSSNPYLWPAIFITLMLQTIVIYVPMLASVFKVGPLSMTQYLTCLIQGFMFWPIVDGAKIIKRIFKNFNSKPQLEL